MNLQLSAFSAARRRARSFLEREWSLFAENLRDAFEEALVPRTYDGASIAVHVTRVQAHGAAKSCVINAVSLALMDAGIELVEPLFSMTAGYLRAFGATPLLDLAPAEEAAAQGEATLALLLQSDRVVFAETRGAKMNAGEFRALVEAVRAACGQMRGRVEAFLRQHYRAQALLSA